MKLKTIHLTLFSALLFSSCASKQVKMEQECMNTKIALERIGIKPELNFDKNKEYYKHREQQKRIFYEKMGLSYLFGHQLPRASFNPDSMDMKNIDFYDAYIARSEALNRLFCHQELSIDENHYNNGTIKRYYQHTNDKRQTVRFGLTPDDYQLWLADFKQFEALDIRNKKLHLIEFQFDQIKKTPSKLTIKADLEYPDQKGKLREEAEVARKKYLQKMILRTLYSIYLSPSIYEEFEFLTKDKLIMPLNESEFDEISTKIEDISNNFFLKESRDYALLNDILQRFDDFKFSNEEDLKKIIKINFYNKNSEREKMLGTILLSEAKINVTRPTKENFSINVELDIESAAKKINFKSIKSLTE